MVVNVPVLFIIFNRLDTTKQVFEEIRKAKPKKLFIAADGPRNKEAKKKTDLVRKYVLDNIDWDCEYKTLFRENNLGCGRAVSGAIDWFFDNIEMGIILEDDCLPDQSFFKFCEELLKKYKNNKKIMQISGFNPVSKNNYSNKDYFFSYFGSIWGWATWRRAWKKFDFDMKYYNRKRISYFMKTIGFDNKMIDNKIKLFEITKDGLIDTWDYQWVYSVWFNNGLYIVPSKNLIKNVGWGKDSIHNKGSGDRFSVLPFEKISFPLKHPKKIIDNSDFNMKFYYFFNRPFIKILFDYIYFRFFFKIKNWWYGFKQE
jgi:hypothetical protein